MPKASKIPFVRFNLKDKTDAERETLIYLFFRYKGKRLKYSTGEKVKPKYWNENRATNTRKHPEYSELNSRLSEVETHTIDIFKEFDFGNIALEDFKKELDYRTGKEERPTERILEFFPFIQNYIEEKQNAPNAKRGTWKKYLTVFNHLKDYAEEKKGIGKELLYNDITWEFRYDFENWLYSPPRNHATNNASKIISVTRQFMHEATRRKQNTNLTFQEKGWVISEEKIKHITLSFDELKILFKLDLTKNNRLEKVRDLFLIGAYSGLRYSDFIRIKPENIIKEKGVEILEIVTIKTETEVAIPLMPELNFLLKKYDYHSPPTISGQRMNDYLKELCKLAGFTDTVSITKSIGGKRTDLTMEKWEKVTTHTARRSFATNFYQLGIPAALLMLITGHATERQFMGYINIGKRQNARNIAKQIAMLRKEQSHLKVI